MIQKSIWFAQMALSHNEESTEETWLVIQVKCAEQGVQFLARAPHMFKPMHGATLPLGSLTQDEDLRSGD